MNEFTRIALGISSYVDITHRSETYYCELFCHGVYYGTITKTSERTTILLNGIIICAHEFKIFMDNVRLCMTTVVNAIRGAEYNTFISDVQATLPHIRII